MIYVWFKALHVLCVVIWMGGTLAGALLLRFAAQQPAPQLAIIAAMQKWDRRITTSASGLVYLIGIYLIIDGGWWPDIWLMIKLAGVVVISAVHGMVSADLRRLKEGKIDNVPPRERFYLPVFFITIAIIIAMVIVKPFV